jgi:hypothetical protein
LRRAFPLGKLRAPHEIGRNYVKKQEVRILRCFTKDSCMRYNRFFHKTKPKRCPMHEIKVLHNYLSKSLPEIHTARLSSLVCGVKNALNANQLTLTSLGRSCNDNTQVKNKIKRMDRLLGNKMLHKEIIEFYKVISRRIICNKKHPIITVDWASIDNRNKFHVLKASIAYEGRSITLLDQIEYRTRPKKQGNNSHDQFIDNLHKILPEGCQPIIIGDAAFSAKWFKRVEAKGWYWVGRLRGKVKIYDKENKVWKACKEMFCLAGKQVKELGGYEIAKHNKLNCQLFIAKQVKKGRVRKNIDGSRKKVQPSQDFSKLAKEPWLLASNLPNTYNRANKVINSYKKRMQIEEVFRDIKSSNYGLGIRYTLSETKERVAVLMLIGALALLILGILGKAAYNEGIYKQFQANTIRNRKVLSCWYLGRQVYLHMSDKIPISMFQEAFNVIIEGVLTYEML